MRTEMWVPRSPQETFSERDITMPGMPAAFMHATKSSGSGSSSSSAAVSMSPAAPMLHSM